MNLKVKYEVCLKFLATTSGKHDCGVKKLTLETVADSQILMDLRIAVEETCYPFKAKKYLTKCVSVGKNETEGKNSCGF